MELDSKILDLIGKTCKGKKHIKMTVGYFKNNEKSIKVFDETGETGYKNYIYEIGSITKTFNASLLAKFINEHKISLDDSIKKYIAGLDTARYYPDFRRLSTHTAGYPARYPLNRTEYLKFFIDMIMGTGITQGENPLNIDMKRIKMIMLKHKLQDKDYRWEYSNFGFALIGYALGIVSGKGYWAAMNDFLSNELGMRDSYLGTFEEKNLHGFNIRNRECGNWHWDEDNVMAPAGAISSTADDLLTYAKLNMYEEKPYLRLCHQKHAKGPKGYGMGLGWWLRKENNNIIEHGGGTGCFSSYLAVDKEKKVASVVLANYRLEWDRDKKTGVSVLESL